MRRFARAWGGLRDLWTWEDATHAALTGILLALVREAWGDVTRTTTHVARVIANGKDGAEVGRTDLWDMESHDNDLDELCVTASEAEALVAALEAAPQEVGP
jgi:hypothetical protein